MSSLFNYLSNLKLKNVLAINIFLAILVLIPTTVYLSSQETKISSKAYLPQPTSTLFQPTATPTPLAITPSGPVEITKVFPFYGKAGDSVIITGKNFGNQKDVVLFNNFPAGEIVSWLDTKIHVLVPSGAFSGPVQVKNIRFSYIFTVFDKTTACEIVLAKTETQKNLDLKNCPAVSKIKITLEGNLADYNLIYGSGIVPANIKTEKITKDGKEVNNLEIANPNNAMIGKLLTLEKKNNTVLSLISISLEKDNNPLSFYINPLSLDSGF